MTLGEIVTELRSIFPNGHPDFIPITLEEMRLHSEKNFDYAHGGDALGNFKRVSDMFNEWGYESTPAEIAFEYMMKQVDAVGNMFGQEYEGRVEGKIAKLRDISVYAKLCMLLLLEQDV